MIRQSLTSSRSWRTISRSIFSIGSIKNYLRFAERMFDKPGGICYNKMQTAFVYFVRFVAENRESVNLVKEAGPCFYYTMKKRREQSIKNCPRIFFEKISKIFEKRLDITPI